MFAGLVAGFTLAPGIAAALEFPALPGQMQQYEAPVPKTIIELQPFRRHQTTRLASGDEATLIALNPNINISFLLTIRGNAFHFENPDPAGQSIALADAPLEGLVITKANSSTLCLPWISSPSELRLARATNLPYAPFCDSQLYLRNVVSGSRSNLEAVTGFLRDHVWQGDQIVNLVKGTFYQDEFAETSDLVAATTGGTALAGPKPAQIEPKYAEQAIAPAGFGIALTDPKQTQLVPGVWYPTAGLPGVYASAIQPRTILADILKGPGTANRLDSVEGRAVDYLVAYDMDRFGIGYALGTDHPRLDWSPRPRGAARIRGLPGPDGIRDAKPLVRSGMVSPDYAGRTIATFAAGFKRSHGAFKYGDYASIDTGKHYGFIEKGVIYSKLKTELATLYVLDDGTTEMKTWKDADNALLPRIMFARQNGVALIEPDPVTGVGMPGARVPLWGPGNWSGSADADLRTLRAGACMQGSGDHRYLIYAYFSTATPSAMARVFQAYGCNYAMLLDMNALELTYMALYPRKGGNVVVEHIVTGMAQIDKIAADGTVIPRFLGYPDNRDLFFLYRKEATK
jgi:hypothetical protein